MPNSQALQDLGNVLRQSVCAKGKPLVYRATPSSVFSLIYCTGNTEQHAVSTEWIYCSAIKSGGEAQHVPSMDIGMLTLAAYNSWKNTRDLHVQACRRPCLRRH